LFSTVRTNASEPERSLYSSTWLTIPNTIQYGTGRMEMKRFSLFGFAWCGQ
jgi:hypothetical protein